MSVKLKYFKYILTINFYGLHFIFANFIYVFKVKLFYNK